jgi:hypothetical protein
MEKLYGLGPRVVLLLSGAGERSMTPIRLSGRSLVLYFTPSARGDKPLVLTPSGTDPAGALIEVGKGDVEILGGVLRLPDTLGARCPPWLLEVRGGDVRLAGCRLEGPVRNPPGSYRGLVHLVGSGEGAADKARACLVHQAVLLSGRDGFFLDGVGAGLRLRQSLLVANGVGVHLALGTKFAGRANALCLLDHTTVAAKEVVVRLADSPTSLAPVEPTVVQSRHCAFLNPFRIGRPGLLLYEGDALARGLLVWQSQDDFWDRRLYFVATASRALPERPQGLASWLRLWGANVRRPVTDVLLTRTLEAVPWALERLALPPAQGAYGADLGALGISKKPG